VARAAEEDDEAFAAEKKDIMTEIESMKLEDPNYRLRPSASMGREMTTSISFGNLTGHADSSRLLEDGTSSRLEDSSTLRR
jgi:hypothetical protein